MQILLLFRIVAGNIAGTAGGNDFEFVVQESDTTTGGDFANAPASAVTSATNIIIFFHQLTTTQLKILVILELKDMSVLRLVTATTASLSEWGLWCKPSN